MLESVADYFTTDLAARVRWRMRFDRNPLLITLQDKFAVREYANTRGVATARLYHVTEDPHTIPFESLPPRYMIKASHGWGWNIACSDSRLLLFGDGSGVAASPTAAAPQTSVRQLSRSEAVSVCQSWLRDRHSVTEWAYQHIRPQIIVEEFLTPRQGSELHDYRMYTFDGVVKAINVGSPSYRRDNLNAFFYPDWTLIPLSHSLEELPHELPARPERLNELITAASRIGGEIDFARVDLYDTNQGVVLGEVTVYPQGGTRRSPSGCPRLDRWLGQQWRMHLTTRMAVRAMNIATVVPDGLRSIRSRFFTRRMRSAPKSFRAS